jgi:hypothetical protein
MPSATEPRLRSILALASKAYKANPTPATLATVRAARADHRACMAERAEQKFTAKVRALVDAAPPLTADTRDRLALLLRSAA